MAAENARFPSRAVHPSSWAWNRSELETWSNENIANSCPLSSDSSPLGSWVSIRGGKKIRIREFVNYCGQFSSYYIQYCSLRNYNYVICVYCFIQILGFIFWSFLFINFCFQFLLLFFRNWLIFVENFWTIQYCFFSNYNYLCDLFLLFNIDYEFWYVNCSWFRN